MFTNFRDIQELTNSMKQNFSWTTATRLANQAITHILWNSNAHCRVHKSPQLVSTLIHINEDHILKTYISDPF